MLVASGPAFAQTYTDYDTDDDNLIDITTIAQLQGIRWDHDGNGFIRSDLQATDGVDYNAAFPNRQTAPSLESTLPRMGCPGVCLGYELMNDLDFATAASNLRTWGQGYNYEGILEGNGYTISASYAVGGSATTIQQAGANIGGLVGSNEGTIIASYARVSVSGNTGDQVCNAGGLAGNIGSIAPSRPGTVIASYAAGNITCTSTSSVSFHPDPVQSPLWFWPINGNFRGGLAGRIQNTSSVVSNSYCDNEAAGLSSACIRIYYNGNDITNFRNPPPSYTTAEMQAPPATPASTPTGMWT